MNEPDEDNNGGKPVYLPTPEEIKRKCAEIRATWPSHLQRQGDGHVKVYNRVPVRRRPL